MKYIKSMAFVLVLVLFLATIGCKNVTSESASSEQPPFFLLNETQVIFDDDNQSSEIFERIYDNTRPFITISHDYGEIVPYVAKYCIYKSDDKNAKGDLYLPIYGFMTLDGKIITDAVFDGVRKHQLDDDLFFYEVAIGGNAVTNEGQRFLLSGSGKWMFDIPKSKTYTGVCGGGFFMLEQVKKVNGVDCYYHDFYDYNGKYKFTFDKAITEQENTTHSIGRFSDGYAPVTVSVKDPKTSEITTTCYYIDTNGNKAELPEFKYCGEFNNGYAIVKNEQSLYGVINTKGEYFIAPEFDVLKYYDQFGLFLCGFEGGYRIIDKTGTLKKMVFAYGTVELVSAEPLIYKNTNKHTGKTEYFYAETGEPFICKGTGQFADEETAFDGLYACSYGGVTSIFNNDGKVVCEAKNFGLVAAKLDNGLVLVDKTGLKTATVLYEKTPKTLWMDFVFTGKTFANRYVVLKAYVDLVPRYYLYDPETQKFIYENCDFIDVYGGSSEELLTVVQNADMTVYDVGFSKVLSINNIRQVLI